MRRALLIGMLLLLWLLPVASASAAADDDDDRIVLVGSVLVDRDETAGDVIVVDGDVTIRGRVTGDLVVVDGDVTIRGTVEGDVVAVAGLATLGRRGNVAGDLVYGDDKPVQAPGSRVGGKVKKIKLGDASIIAAIGLWIGFTISLLLLGLVLLALAPRAGEAVARTGRAKPAIAALVVGRMIRKQGLVLTFVIGLVILQLLTLIPIAGGILAFLAIVFGLGVLLLALLRARS
jgi:cytoskeletal protein CcmA (bactofilin family)